MGLKGETGIVLKDKDEYQLHSSALNTLKRQFSPIVTMYVLDFDCSPDQAKMVRAAGVKPRVVHIERPQRIDTFSLCLFSIYSSFIAS
jgi:hypothetical protein